MTHKQLGWIHWLGFCSRFDLPPGYRFAYHPAPAVVERAGIPLGMGAVMVDFEVQRFTRRCAATDRELRPNEWYYSVLVQNGADVVRLDYSAESWTGPPAESMGWWKARMPNQQVAKGQWAPSDVMLEYLEKLLADPTQADMAYVLALLLVRRRVLRLDGSERDAADQEQLLMSSLTTEQEYRIPVVTPSRQRANQIQDTLLRLLFGDGGGAIVENAAERSHEGHAAGTAAGPKMEATN